MNRKKFLDFLTDENGNFYKVVNGVVQSNQVPKPLEHSPMGWKDHQIKAARNTTYHGMFRTFSLPLKFVKKAAFIIRERLYKYGIEDIINYTKLILDNNTGTHKLFYTGQLNLTKAKDTYNTIEAESISGGLEKLFKANESVNYEIELTGNGVVDVNLDTCKLQQNAMYIVNSSVGSLGTKLVGLSLITTNQKDSFNAKNATMQEIHIESQIMGFYADEYFIKTQSATDFYFDFNIEIYGEITIGYAPRNFALCLFGYDENDNKIIEQNLCVATRTNLSENATGTIANFLFNASNVVVSNVQKSTRLFALILGYDNSNNTFFDALYTHIQFLEAPDLSSNKYFFNAKYSYKKQSTICKAINPIELGNRLLQAATGSNQYSIISNKLSSSSIYITCGDAIRGLTGSKIKTNLKDYFLSYNKTLCLGLDIKFNNIIIENRKLFYDNTQLIYDLGEIKNIEIKPVEDLLFKTIKVGSPNQDYDDLNGKMEFNTTYEFATHLTQTKNELNLVSPYRKDMYGVTFAQINLEGKATNDSSSDNDVFMLDIDLNSKDNIVLSNSSTDYTTSTFPLKLNKTSGGNSLNTLSKDHFYINAATQNITITGTVILSVANCVINVKYNWINTIYTANSSTTTLNINATFKVNNGDMIFFEIVSPNNNTTVLSSNINFLFNIPTSYNLYRYPNQQNVITGLIYPETAFNVRLSPKRCLKAHGDWIKGILQPYNSKKITYQTSNKNTISTSYNGVTIDEKSDETIGNLGANYFLPYYAQFETIVPKTLFDFINIGMNGFFKFTYKNKIFYGYPMDCSQKPAGNESQVFNLLLTNQNNINDLIN